ncbi:MAG: hypothetical protein ACN4GW_21135 [Desulforhopalus sp.]
MKWVEVIHMRITKRDIEGIVPIVQKLAGEAIKESSCQEIKMYRRALVNTDLSILLFHDTMEMEKSGSPLGLRINSALKEFGLVNHNTWFELGV